MIERDGWGGAALNRDQPSALVIAGGGATKMEAAVLAAGGRLAASASWNEVAERLRTPGPLSVLAVDCVGTDDTVLALALPHILAVAHAHDTRIIVAFEQAQIDIVVANLFGPDVDLLCAPSQLDLVAALSLTLLRAGSHVLQEASRDADTSRLQRLNDEIARIAETLARLSREDATPPTREAPSDRKREAAAVSTDDPLPAVTAREVRAAIRARRLRDQYFESGLFEDPAWDILLDLFAAELERAQVSVSSLCIAAAVAPTTALRWIAKMTEAGLLIRHPDPFDRRRAFMGLSPTALEGMRRYSGAVKRAGLRIA
ncbi:hypothetical protein [Sphingomonas immobilis]|uniref:HTH marR-type domain-containing protein n=1 Tax=Sphingomonas immobilis TaxID=3063997 RepID=A0ABT9A299_9SPHN|nr:hypothetical protein [Sphingomonas sp. CA1-15]MDO7843484.1 hypothetical protein [Sphingomonas sp. CA1-15]